MAESNRILPGGYIYSSDLLSTPHILKNGGTINGMISLLSEFDSTLVGVVVFAENQKGDRNVANYKSLLAVTDINVKENRVDVELGNILALFLFTL